MFALSRLTLWGVLDEGVEGIVAARLGAALDRACLILSEGQYLDISFEQRLNISVAMYIDMIERKTGALMACAAEMGGLLGTPDGETIESLRRFGWAMGVAFQVRDDMLGVWATAEELGKTSAGDIYRRKKSLPILHALEHASTHEQSFLRDAYTQTTPLTPEQVEQVLSIFNHTDTRAYCRDFLARQCKQAYEALASVPRYTHPIAGDQKLRCIAHIKNGGGKNIFAASIFFTFVLMISTNCSSFVSTNSFLPYYIQFV